MTNKPTTCYNGMDETKGGKAMPRQKKHEEGYNKSPEGIAYRVQYRKDHYARLAMDIPPEFLEKLDAAAKAEGLSRAKFVMAAVTEYIETHEQDG